MATYDFDAFGNPVKRPVNGKPRSTAADTPQAYCDGVYDPAMELYSQPVQPHPQSVGLFTSLENHQVPIHDPASLAKFLYAGHAPVEHIDPA
jgi:hypothetical protein